MAYIHRNMEAKILSLSEEYSAILITGACVKIGLNQEKPYK